MHDVGRAGAVWWSETLTHLEGFRLYPRAPEPIPADIQELDATGQQGQSHQLVLWEDQIPQGRQPVEGVIVNGGDEVAGKVNPFQFC